MVFTAPSWVPKLPFGKLPSDYSQSKDLLTGGSDPPDDVPLCQFMIDSKYGRNPLQSSRNPFTCGITGRTYTAVELADRVELLARALAVEFNWEVNHGTEWDKVAGIFALNTVGYNSQQQTRN